jgi:outer membrane receptor protein involved in Fe transport
LDDGVTQRPSEVTPIAHRRRWRVVALALALAAVAARPTAAQDGGVVAGVVVAEGTAAPLSDVQVSVEGTTQGASTDAQGRFRITGLAGDQVRLNLRRLGYRPLTQVARVGDTELRLVLGTRALELEQVVVTGTAGATERRQLGNAVSQVNAAEIVATQPVQNFQELLNARAPGVNIIPGSGQVGTGSRIRIRGASSLSLTNEPLIYVDGVRVDNTQASGPSSQAFGSRPISRWNDFNPDDIESIEVLKGPAAATLYGTDRSSPSAGRRGVRSSTSPCARGRTGSRTPRGASGRTTVPSRRATRSPTG